jgi:phytoene dehydrogenase-like protein
MTADSRRVVVIGGGHNGLAAAFYLAEAGWSPLVLERREEVGGGAVTRELHPGFRCPTLSHHVLVWSQIVQEMDLPGHGGALITPEVQLFAPRLDGPPLVLYADTERTVDGAQGLGDKDREAFSLYRDALARIAPVVGALLEAPPPDVSSPSPRDAWGLLQTGRKFRALGRRDAYRLIRWASMPAADLMHEWFDDELLRAALAAPGLSGTMLGPRSAGSALVMLLHETHHWLAGGVVRARGGPGALTQAMATAARNAGAEIRTGAGVERIVVRDAAVTGVICNGEEIPAGRVLAAIDPKTTFLRLVDPLDLEPDFLQKVRNYRSAGTLAKVNLALSGLPRFTGAPGIDALSGRIHIGPSLDYMERAFDHAKYGECSTEPWLDVTLPSILDPSLAPVGAHVMSVYVHYAPFRLRNAEWHAQSDGLVRVVLQTLERFAPGISALVVAAQAITPEQLEREYGLHGGHVFHGELALDQLFAMRPLLGFARYDSPIQGLHLCGGGTHPGGFMTAASGRHAARRLISA